MTLYHWILVAAFSVCFFSCLFQLLHIILSSKSKDYAASRGRIGSAIVYSFTGAMSPFQKESAYLHLPTYAAGILFHLGTFLSLFWLALHFFSITANSALIYSSAIFLIVTFLCGGFIFIKRIVNFKMRFLSHPDDYFSNLLVTGFQFLSAMVLVTSSLFPLLFIWAAILFLYIPIGKLRHVVYFFTSRIYLGLFYGNRGVWQLKKYRERQSKNL